MRSRPSWSLRSRGVASRVPFWPNTPCSGALRLALGTLSCRPLLCPVQCGCLHSLGSFSLCQLVQLLLFIYAADLIGVGTSCLSPQAHAGLRKLRSSQLARGSQQRAAGSSPAPQQLRLKLHSPGSSVTDARPRKAAAVMYRCRISHHTRASFGGACVMPKGAPGQHTPMHARAGQPPPG